MTHEQTDTRTARASTIRDGAGRPMLIALLVFAVCAAGLGGWASMAPVAGAVVANGEIRIQGERKTVQHLEGGIVAEILVRESERVRAGQLLVRLDATEARATHAALSAENDALSTRAIRLRAELAGGARPEFDVPANAGVAIDAAIAAQTALFDARTRVRTAEIEMLNGTLARFDSRADAVRAELEGVAIQISLLEEERDAKRQLSERGIATRDSMRETERVLAALNGTRASLRAQLAETAASAHEAELKRAEADTQRVSAISEELSKVVARMAEVTPMLEAEEKRIARAEIRAPVGGAVVGLAVATVGGVIAPGEPVMHIVPESAVHIAEVRVSPEDRDRLVNRVDAEVRLIGMQRSGDGTIQGEITNISADRLNDERKDSTPYYLMQIGLNAVPDNVGLEPGMPVAVVVPTESRTVLDYILSPIRDAISRSMREE